MTDKKRRIHFIGIGGIGVSGIALLAHKRGDEVSGSDVKSSGMTDRLKRQGIPVVVGHAAENVEGAELVVYSSAIRQDNPELVAARKAGIPVRRRAEFLSELMSDKQVIAIAGAHGKTTTSSLAAKLLTHAGLRPTVAVGGVLREEGANARWNDSPYFVAEADESDGTFLCYAPTYSVITNIDEEHMDFYKTKENLWGAFEKFIRQTRQGGCVFYFHEDPFLGGLVQKTGIRGLSFGWVQDADFYAEDVVLEQDRVVFAAVERGRALGDITLRLMGRHNILNALAVIALSREMHIDFAVTAQALAQFQGVERRFQIKHEDAEVMIVDDYGHHPTEILATLEAAKACPRRLVVVFQPHRFTRTKLLMDRFAESFGAADRLLVTDIYPAGEDPIEGVTAQAMVKQIRGKTNPAAEYVAGNHIVGRLKDIMQRGDLVLFLGAGDITKKSDEFTEIIQKQDRVP